MTTNHSNNACSRETAADRLASVATVLAQGLLRLRKHRGFTPDSDSQETQESGVTGLELPAESRLSVSHR